MNYIDEEQFARLEELVAYELGYANRCYDRACDRHRQNEIEFYSGKMEAYALMQNKIRAFANESKPRRSNLRDNRGD